ncbi:YjcZ family sporulation protein [Cytobacillus praedii]
MLFKEGRFFECRGFGGGFALIVVYFFPLIIVGASYADGSC